MGTVWVVSIIYLNDKYPDIEWDWENINTKDLYFPKNFLRGTATAAHQVEGSNTNNNWYRWEHSFDQNGKSRIHNSDKSGNAANHWNLYKQDMKIVVCFQVFLCIKRCQKMKKLLLLLIR